MQWTHCVSWFCEIESAFYPPPPNQILWFKSLIERVKLFYQNDVAEQQQPGHPDHKVAGLVYGRHWMCQVSVRLDGSVLWIILFYSRWFEFQIERSKWPLQFKILNLFSSCQEDHVQRGLFLHSFRRSTVAGGTPLTLLYMQCVAWNNNNNIKGPLCSCRWIFRWLSGTTSRRCLGRGFPTN